MRVRAAGTERTYARSARQNLAGHTNWLPILKAPLHAEEGFLELDVRVQSLSMQRRYEFSVLELEQQLRHTRDAGRRLAVSDVRLDRANRTELAGRFARDHVVLTLVQGFRKCLLQAGDFDRVTKHRSRAMCLDVIDCRRIDLCLP